MYKIFTLACFAALFTACQVGNSLIQGPDLQQTINFQRGEITPGKFYTFKVSPGFSYRATYTQEANTLVFAHQDEAWLTGVQALNKIAEKIIRNAQNELSFSERVDLEMVIYYNFDNFIFNAPPSADRNKAAAQNLRTIIKYGEPTEIGRLAKALKLAASALPTTEGKALHQQVSQLASEIRQTPEAFQKSPKMQQYLREEAGKALTVLTL